MEAAQHVRHLAATLMLTNGVPLALVSKTLRHSKTGITADPPLHVTVRREAEQLEFGVARPAARR